MPPTGLIYTLNSAVYTKNTAIVANTPSSSGGSVVSYAVTPALPAGLSLSSTTGQITGTPSAIAALASYTVTATNTGGSATAVVTITVNDIAPSNLTYGMNPAVYTKNTAIANNIPSSSGGEVVSYEVSPPLPTGLSLSTTTGVIFGTPTVAATSASYTVTATNTGGSTTASVTITVNAIATITGNTGVTGALITYTGGTATTDGSGNYTFTVPYDWSGTVTPTLAGYTFSPASRTYTNVLADQTAQNFTATAVTYTISGALGANGAGASLAYTNGSAKTATADGSGNYTFTVPYDWSGTVTPTLAGFTFSPVNRSYTNLLADQTAQDFSATADTYTISGSCGAAGAGTSLAYTDGSAKTATADGSGNYTFTVSSNWSGTVNPSLAGFIFSPPSTTYANVLANQTQDYTAVPAPSSYVGGISATNLDGSSIPGYWRDGTWVGLPLLSPEGLSVVTSLVVDGKDRDVYAGGFSYNSSGVDVPGYWKNGSWVGLPPLEDNLSAQVYSLVVSGGDVYASGLCKDNIDTSVPGYWKNGSWVGLPPLEGNRNAVVYALVVSGDDVYAGGYSSNSDDVSVPGYWKNGTWVPLTPLDVIQDSQVFSLVVSGNDVYAGGSSTDNSGVQIAGYWKNGLWVGLPQTNMPLLSIAVSGGDVYAASGRDDGSGNMLPGYFKNETWVDLPSPGVAGDQVMPLAMVVSGNDVHVTGLLASMSAEEPTVISGYWKNGVWSTLTPPEGGTQTIALPVVAPFFTISGNAGVAGALLAYTDGTDKIAVADALGNYCFNVRPDWSGTVTPSKAGSTFMPASKSYTHVMADQSQDYTTP